MRRSLIIAASLGFAAATLVSAQTPSTQPSGGATATASAPASRPALRGRERREDFEKARRRALQWLDELEVNAAELDKHDVKGIKKLGEALYTYFSLYEYAGDPGAREHIRKQAERLAAQTHQEDYHKLLSEADPQSFDENNMSYLRVLYLLELFGFDTKDYREHVMRIKPRLDASFSRRGAWQRAMFAEYYDRFALEKPPLLENLDEARGILDVKPGPDKFNVNMAYELTHEVYVAYDYGLRKVQDHLTDEDVAYLRKIIPVLIYGSMKLDKPDIAAELLSCMTYLGMQRHPLYDPAIDYLLSSQHQSGKWGDWEQYRPKYGVWLEQQGYLHTTMVAMRALLEVFEDQWPEAVLPE